MKRVPVARRFISMFSFNGLRRGCASVVLVAAGLAPHAEANAQSWPASVRADYDVSFNGFAVGSFEFQAEAERQSYTITGNASLSLLLGAISWKSEIRTAGALAKEAPKPAGYALEVVSGSKAISTRVGFEEGGVRSISNVPLLLHSVPVVPLKAQHLQGVVDPMSAMMMLASSNTPCERRLPIFDGRERFDLVFTRKGETRINEQQPSGQPGIGHICKVRYVPIAGHKSEDSGTRYMASNDDIEVVLRPIPSAKLFVPYQISIPLPVGSAKLTSKRVEIAQAGRPRIALLH